MEILGSKGHQPLREFDNWEDAAQAVAIATINDVATHFCTQLLKFEQGIGTTFTILGDQPKDVENFGGLKFEVFMKAYVGSILMIAAEMERVIGTEFDLDKFEKATIDTFRENCKFVRENKGKNKQVLFMETARGYAK